MESTEKEPLLKGKDETGEQGTHYIYHDRY